MPTDKEFEDILRNRFDDFEDEPPLEGWSKLQQDLKRHRSPRKRWPFSIIAILLLIGVAWKEPATVTQSMPTTAEAETTTSFVLENKDQQKIARQQRTEKAKASLHQEVTTDAATDSVATARLSLPVVEKNKEPNQVGSEQNRPSIQSHDKPELPPTRTYRLEEPIQSTPSDRKIALHSLSVQANKDKVEWKKSREGNNEQPKRANSLLASSKEIELSQSLNDSEEVEQNPFSAKGNKLKITTLKRIEQPRSGKEPLLETNLGNSQTPTGRSVAMEEKSANESLSFLVGINTKLAKALPIEMTNHRLDSLLRTQSLLPVALVTKAKPDSTRKPSSRLPYAFGVYFSPRYAFSRFTPNREDDLLIANIRTEGKSMRMRLGYEAGFTGSRLLSDRWVLNSSLVFIHLNETLDFSSKATKPDSVTWGSTNGGSSTVTPHFNSHQQRYESSYNYLGLNVGASYSFWKRKQGNWYASAGGGLNVLVKGKTNLYKEAVFVDTIRFPSPTTPLEQINYRLSVGIGYAHRIGERAELTFEPTISYFLGSSFKEREPVGMKPYTLGLNIGLRFGH